MGRKTRGTNQGFRARPDLRLALKLRDGFMCGYCGRDLSGAKFSDVTIDHLACQKKAHNNEPSNLITACRTCNCERQTQPWTAFAFAKGGKTAIKRIQRNRRRDITKYRTHAKQIIADGYRNRTRHSSRVIAGG